MDIENLGLGVDIVKTDRFKNLKPRFIARVYTPGEQEYLNGKHPQSYAGIFAAKEAVAKALGTGFTADLQPTDIEILHDPRGKPYLHGNENIQISISHTATDAIAFAVMQGYNDNKGGEFMPNYGANLREQLLEKALRDTGNEDKLVEINETMIQFYAGNKVRLPIKSDKED